MWIPRLSVALLLLVLSALPAWANKADYLEQYLQNGETATRDGTAIAVDRYTMVALEVTVTDVATITFEGSVEGSTATAVSCVFITDGALYSATSSSGIYQCNVAGLKSFRARISAYTSGTVTVYARASTALLSRGGGGGSIATNAAPTYVEGTSNPLSMDLSGNLRVTPGTLLSGEDQPNDLIRTSGGAVRTVTVMTGVTTNTTGSALTIFSGGKTGIAQVSGTGAVTATVNLYGNNDTTTANGILVCGPIALSGTTLAKGKCPQWTEDYPYYYAVSSNVTGTGATVEFIAAVGATGSVAGGGGSVTNAGTFVVQENGEALTALQLIDDDQTGSSLHHKISVGTTEDETEIKATDGRLLSISATNTNAAVRYLRCANLTAANTTPGTSAVFFGIAIPAGGGVALNFGPSGIAFSTALTCWLVTGAAETDVAEVAANEINWNIGYK